MVENNQRKSNQPGDAVLPVRVEPLTAPLAGVLNRYRGSAGAREKRKPGRPVKRSETYFTALLTAHRAVAAWFIAERGRPAHSDRELYTAYFACQFELQGARAGRATSPAFQGPLKTLRNELAEARRIERVNPGNGGVLGTTSSVECECAKTREQIPEGAAWD